MLAAAAEAELKKAEPTAAAAAPAPAPAPTQAAPEPLPAGAVPKLVSLRGIKIGVEYPIYEGSNYIGRSDEQPVDIDLEDQEKPEGVWSSRQHACVHLENGLLFVEDLGSANGTYLNRARVLPHTRAAARVGDVIQIGAIHLRIKA